MLTGVALLGLVAAMAPILALLGGDGDDDDPDTRFPGETTPDDPTEQTDLLAADTAAPEDDDLPDQRQPVDYEYLLGAGDHTIADFVPGEDSLILSSDTWDFELSETDPSGAGSGLEIIFRAATSQIVFSELDTLPIDDIFLSIAEPGEAAVLIPLTDALETGDGPLAPLDPDAPDTLPDAISTAQPARPTDPEAPDPPPNDPSSDPPLAPADPDAPEP